MKLSVIIPVYNEEATVQQVIHLVKAVDLGLDREIVVVNDNSSDGTAGVLGRFDGDSQVRVFHQPFNQGKAAAISRGLKESSGDIVIIQDADLEYHPSQYPQLLEPLLNGSAEAVYGSRFLGCIDRMEWTNRMANYIATATFNAVYGSHLTDVNTCYKLFKRSILKGSGLVSSHFVGDVELTARIVRSGARIVEVPISYVARSVSQGKKMDWPKALMLYGGIFRFRWERM